jgi:hypothetical protein
MVYKEAKSSCRESLMDVGETRREL